MKMTVICTATLPNLSQFWRVMVRYNIRKELFLRRKEYFPKGKYRFYFSQKLLKIASEIKYTLSHVFRIWFALYPAIIVAIQFNSHKSVQKLFHNFHIIFSNSLMGF